jgi:hypothetical protein
MKVNLKSVLSLGLLVALSICLSPTAQVSQDRDTSGSVGSSAPASTPAVSAPQSIPQAYSTSNTSYSGTYSSSRDIAASSAVSGGGSLPATYGMERYINPRTSFWSYDGYYRSMQLFDFLMFNYRGAFGNQYFSRFYMNNEPILNTKVAHYAMQVPMYNAKKLLAIADQMQQLKSKYATGQGKTSLQQDAEFKALLQKAKELAHSIEKYPALEYLEVRKSTNLVGKSDQRDFESNLNQLDSYIRMLQSQFQEIVNSDSPAMISVEQLSQPSFISLAKGIEKLATNLEKTKT